MSKFVPAGDELRCTGLLVIVLGTALFPLWADGQVTPLPPEPRALADLSIDELMQVEVTSVSKKQQRLSQVAAAVHVITQEDIRRSGATMWGANAVNGVINVITKPARDTQGSLFTAGGGSEESDFGGVRYGGMAGRAFYRGYSKFFQRNHLLRPSGVGFESTGILRGRMPSPSRAVSTGTLPE